MPQVARVHTLEIDEDASFEQRQSRIQRVGWFLGLLILAGALLGLFGHGLLSQAQATSADGGLSVHYQRVARDRSDDTLHFFIRDAPSTPDPLVLVIAESYLESLEMKRIVPEPVRSEAGSGEVRFHLAAAPGDGERRIVFQFRHERAGHVRGVAYVLGRARSQVDFAHFVLP